MSIRVAINHVTEYHFDRAVSLTAHTIRLRPAAHSRTPIKAYSLKVSPENHFINWQQDPFGNFLARLVFPEKSDYLRIEVEVIADMTVINPFDFFLEESVERFPFKYDPILKKDLKPYLKIVTD
jgi:transglutaminase-like putative cysteine protease